MRFLVKCLFLIGLQLTLNVSAEDITTDSKPMVEVAEEFADGIHESLSDNIIYYSNMLDNFFVDERMDDEGSHSRVVLGYLTSTDDLQYIHSEYLLKVRLHLPKTQNKLRLVVESSIDFDQEVDEFNIADDLKDAGKNAEYSTALQFIFSESELWQVSSSAGMLFSTPLNPFLRIRLRRLFLLGEWESRLTQTFFWFNEEGMGETTSLDFERKMNNAFFFRTSSKATIVEEDPTVVSANQNFSLFQQLSSKTGLVYSIGADGVLNSPSHVSRYYINTRFRHNFYKKWAFYEVVPAVEFNREMQFEASPVLLLRLDIVIGKV